MSLLPSQFSCLVNLRYYSFGTLICIVIYPKLIKLISSLIVLSFNHQNPLESLDALSLAPRNYIQGRAPYPSLKIAFLAARSRGGYRIRP
jgi:hypothetical protein